MNEKKVIVMSHMWIRHVTYHSDVSFDVPLRHVIGISMRQKSFVCRICEYVMLRITQTYHLAYHWDTSLAYLWDESNCLVACVNTSCDAHVTYGYIYIYMLRITEIRFAEYHLFYRALLQKRPMYSLTDIHIYICYVSLRRIIALICLAELLTWMGYGVATISRLDKIIGLSCKRAL